MPAYFDEPDFPGLYKLVVVDTQAGLTDGYETVDCLEDPLPKDPQRSNLLGLNGYNISYIRYINRVIEHINDGPELEGTELKYFLQNWGVVTDLEHKFCLSLKLGRRNAYFDEYSDLDDRSGTSSTQGYYGPETPSVTAIITSQSPATLYSFKILSIATQMQNTKNSMAEIMPAPYKLVVTPFSLSNPGQPVIFDCFDDSMLGKSKETFITAEFSLFGSYDFSIMGGLTDKIYNSPEVRDTGVKYYRSSWHRKTRGDTFCLVLKREVIETVTEYRIRNGLVSDNIFGMGTPTASTMSDSGVDGSQ
ncbi:hypothetical protein TWF128_008897 [Orbilia oligospora]|nr:hypothetical protein TWF128_008897 [Orbilia oligospora]